MAGLFLKEGDYVVVFDFFCGIFGNNYFDEVIKILSMNPSEKFEGAWTFMEQIYKNTITPLAVGLLFIYFLVNVIQKSASEQFNFDQLFLMCAKMIGAKYLIEHGMEIMVDCYGLGISLIQDLGDMQENSKEFGKHLGDVWKSLTGCNWNLPVGEEVGSAAHKEKVQTPDFWGSIPIMFKLLIPWAIAFFLKMAIEVLCYARIIELLVRTMMAPIAFADFYHEGMNGAGWRFLKKYMAVCLQGFAMAGTVVLYSMMSAGMIGGDLGNINFFDFTIKYLVVSFACLGVLVKSSQITNELLGVG